MYTNYQETEKRELMSRVICDYLKGNTAQQISEIRGITVPTVYVYLRHSNNTICEMYGLVEGKKIIKNIQAQIDKNKKRSFNKLNETKGRGK